MKIGPGKFYELRNGDKAIVFEISMRTNFGAIRRGVGDWDVCTWDKDGFFLEPCIVHELDIMSELAKPKEKLTAWRDSVGHVRLLYGEEPVCADWKRMPHLDEPEGGE